ncbi:MFS transporter [Actinosynnema sp. CA-248983]
MFASLRVRDFRLLWLGRTVGSLGTWLLVVAVPVHVLHLTGSATAAGLALAAEFLPPVVLGPVAGAVVDRWDRRVVLVAADVLRAAAVAVLLLVRAADDVWLVYVALVLEGVGTVVFRPAVQAHVPTIVGPLLPGANALTTATDGAVRLIGAPLGGLLLGLAGWEALVVVDVLTYLFSALAISRTTRRDGLAVVPGCENGPRGGENRSVVPEWENDPQGRSRSTVVPPWDNGDGGRRPRSPRSGSRRSGSRRSRSRRSRSRRSQSRRSGSRRARAGAWRELVAGMRFLGRDRTAGALFLVSTLFLGANAALSALLVPHAATTFGDAAQTGAAETGAAETGAAQADVAQTGAGQTGAAQTGLVLSGLGVGFLLGAPATRRLLHRPAPLLGGALTGTALGFALLFAAPTVPTALAAAVVVGAFGSAVLTTTQTLLQRVTPNALLGRVGAALFTGEAAATFVGALAGAAAAGNTRNAVTTACAITLTAAALATTLLPRKGVPADNHRDPTKPKT